MTTTIPTNNTQINGRKRAVDKVTNLLKEFSMGEQVEITQEAARLMQDNPGMTMDVALSKAISAKAEQ